MSAGMVDSVVAVVSSAPTMFGFNNVRLQRSGWFMDCCMKGYIQHLYRGWS